MYPLAKAGGLGDVAGALPKALRRTGVDVRVMLPAYPSALPHVRNLTSVMQRDDVAGLGAVEILSAETADDAIPLWLVRSQRFFERTGGPYADERGVAWPDNEERFSLLSNAAATFASDFQPWRPHIVHAHDWHAALIPSLLKARQMNGVNSLLTIHNASFHGGAPVKRLRSFGVPPKHLDGLPRAAQSFLGLGVLHADRLNAVSPTYAKEIQTARFGCGLQRFFRARSDKLTGILNGVDYTQWDPSVDSHISEHYNAHSLDGKERCKTALIEEMQLDTASFAPVVGVVSRLTAQKGIDLIVRIADVLVTAGARLVILGQGEPGLERGVGALATRYPQRIAATIRYDEALAHRIMAGSDIFLMPSRFEPCGLNQMYSLRYGTVPVVSAVGGLADTIVDAGQRGIDNGATTGFVMRRFTPSSLAVAIGKAMAVHPIKPLWRTLQRNAMSQDFGWEHAARKYRTLYQGLIS